MVTGKEANNKRAAFVAVTKKNEQEIVCGRRSVVEALRAGEISELFLQEGARGKIIDEIISQAEEQGLRWRRIAAGEFQRGTQGLQHQGILGHLKPFTYCTLEEMLERAQHLKEKPFLLILDHIQDPGNMGSLLRTAEAAGVHGVIIPSRRSASISPTVRKAASGALSYLPVARVANLAQTVKTLKKNGLWIFGGDMEGRDFYYAADFSTPLALVIGNEEKGISRLLCESCDFLVSIPMRGRISSLNSSVAGAFLIYEVCRQRSGWQV